jgi:hypothetical protein
MLHSQGTQTSMQMYCDKHLSKPKTLLVDGFLDECTGKRQIVLLSGEEFVLTPGGQCVPPSKEQHVLTPGECMKKQDHYRKNNHKYTRPRNGLAKGCFYFVILQYK